jgi:hypothetical protein
MVVAYCGAWAAEWQSIKKDPPVRAGPARKIKRKEGALGHFFFDKALVRHLLTIINAQHVHAFR